MNLNTTTITRLAALALLVTSGAAQAGVIECDAPPHTGKDYMSVPDTQVSSCLDAGVGNINGNPGTDAFLSAGGAAAGWVGAGSSVSSPLGATYTQSQTQTPSQTTGTWTIADPNFWLGGGTRAIGIKFGTGNNPDEWFVYRLISGMTSGTFTFFNTFGTGGGLSHIMLYSNGATTTTRVPEPASLALFGLGLVALGLARRRRQHG